MSTPDPAGGSAGAADAGDLAGMFRRYARQLHRYCASRVGGTAAEDVVAETFLVAYERRHGYDPAAGPLSAWLFGIATNLLRRHRRAEARALRALARTGADPLVDDGLADRAAARVDASALTRQVASVLVTLPRRQREVLLLFAVAELEYDEIAAAVGIPVGTVRSAMHRARAKIHAALADPGPDPEPDPSAGEPSEPDLSAGTFPTLESSDDPR